MNKRGQGLSINAIILIILGIVVLVALIFGFVFGFGKFKDIFGGNSDNVAAIVSSCQTACSSQSKYDFCSTTRELKAGKVDLKDITCYYLSQKEKSYGVDECGSITCNVVFTENKDGVGVACKDEAGKIVIGRVVQYLEGNQLKTAEACK